MNPETMNAIIRDLEQSTRMLCCYARALQDAGNTKQHQAVIRHIQANEDGLKKAVAEINRFVW